MTDIAFGDWVDEARRADIAGAAEVRRAELRRSGTELVGPCPVCGGTDRFSINIRKRVFHCRICAAGGDVIALVQHLDSCDFVAACEALTGRPAPSGERGRVDEAERRRRDEARRRLEAERARDETDWRETERHRAFEIWRGGGSIEGTATEAYLLGRNILPPCGGTLRHVEAMPYWLPPDKAARSRAREIHRGPAMLAAIVDDLGKFSGVHCTWIDPARPGAKMVLADPATGELLPAKKVRGSKRRAAIELCGHRSEQPQKLVAGEGIETVLSVRTALLKARGAAALDATAFWSAVDLGHLSGRAAASVAHPTAKRVDRRGHERAIRVPGPLPAADAERALMPPASVVDVLLLGDGDSDRFTTETALRRAAARWSRRPNGDLRTIRIAWAPAGRDFNDVLRGAP